ncbi:hypothetical protein [Picosynechococcus sp. PCC 7117]|uniref:hypothetical protein n=1 Tax=Picosynechococcus sp. PCC 7117 TaxID=195498 RepID=UPI000810E02A|nr:hypothetical protein [Picosynechococcus sp. PCC 7117]ANV86998.1 hypothetical protein AWQ22_05715 [Picosynechococcus sp. PCC 7117]
MSNSIDENSYAGKPGFNWIAGYQKANGQQVAGHWRTNPNETEADNLGTDVDHDGISGAYDMDADGDGILDSTPLNSDIYVIDSSDSILNEQALDEGIIETISEFLSNIF